MTDAPQRIRSSRANPPVPAPLIRALGEQATSLALHGQRAVPQRALQAGFRFLEPELPGALASML